MSTPRRRTVRQGMVRIGGFSLVLLAAAVGWPRPAMPASQLVAVPAEFKKGEAAFNANCALCHGTRGVGTSQGPPFVHKIYEPNHHGDAAFQRAAMMGVRAHHWQFGDMPKISTVTPNEVDEIIKYVRWLQRQAGIF
ncbi:MAG TPA: cytochrome c [Nitrospiraceae bacterium]|nr:cytochrome c [Nitrospiraceae bacterium]